MALIKMLAGLKHIFRLMTVAFVFARYDVLVLFEPMAKNAPAIRFLIATLSNIVPVHSDAKGIAEGMRLANALQVLGPAFIKLGQTLATRPDLLGDEFAHDLSTLQDRLPPFDFSKTAARIENAFGVHYTKKFSHIEDVPMAAASIAQVHKATLHSGEKVAVKVLRPNIRTILEKDIATFRWLSNWAERASSEARRFRLTDIVNMIEATVKEETNLVNEGKSADALAEMMKDERFYRVPKIYWDYTADTILTLEFVEGTPINDHKTMLKRGIDPKKVSQSIVSIFLKQAIYNGFFHADLHQGNLFVEDDGTIIPIDFGIMGRLDNATRRFLAEILWGFQLQDYHKIAQVHFDAGYVPEEQSVQEFGEAMREITAPILDRPIREISFAQLLADLLSTTRRFSMQAQPQLLLLQRSMVMVEGLAYQLDRDANMWRLSKPLLQQWVQREQLRAFFVASNSFVSQLPFAAQLGAHFKDKYHASHWEKFLTLLAQYLQIFMAAFDAFIDFLKTLFAAMTPQNSPST